MLPWMQIIVHCAPLGVTKVMKDKQVAFHAFPTNTRTKKERHRANHVQPTKKVKTPVLRNVTSVEQAKRLKKVVLNVQNVMQEKLAHHVQNATWESIVTPAWVQIIVQCVTLVGTKTTQVKQVVFHAFLANTRTKKAKQNAKHVLRIRFRRRKQETQRVMFVLMAAHLSMGVSSVHLALQVNTLR